MKCKCFRREGTDLNHLSDGGERKFLQNGITMVELLITLAITSIIAGMIAMPSMRGYTEGRAKAAEVMVQKIEMAKHEYLLNYPYSTGTVSGNEIRKFFPGKDIPNPPSGFQFVEVEYNADGGVVRESVISNPNTFNYVIGNSLVAVQKREN